MKRRLLSGLLAILMFAGQFAWTATAAADDQGGTPTPTPTEVVSPSPTSQVSPSPTAEASPDATVSPTPTSAPTATPDPTATQSPLPSVEPSASPAVDAATVVSPSPSASASPDVATSKVKKDQDSTVTGPDGCGGVVPDWVFDTVSRTWIAADKPSFTCDKASGYYLSPKYYFDKRIGWYEIIPASAAKPDYLITAPNLVHTVLGDLVVGSQDYQVAKALGLLDSSGGGGILTPGSSSSTVTGTGANSSNLTSTATSGQSWFDLTNLVNVINTLQSNATSGNVDVGSNTQVGNVATGAASVVANLINLLASAWSWSNGSLSFFMQNILAPLTGDINLNPTVTTTGGGGALGNATINGTGTDSTNTINIDNPSSLNVNAKNTGSITNNVDVNAVSGDASASKNTSIGNVASGSAAAQVNIINLINSFITSGSSFFGILNIIGSLNGDILFPAGFLNGLVPMGSSTPAATTANIAGTGSGSNNQLGVDNSNAATINNSTNNSVNNNIQTTAASGAATVGSNTSVGGISTGAASTNQGLFNLANSSIFGDNAVLVMVNVLGHWVGKIMTLPGTGNSQAALLTGNAQVGTNGPTTSLSATNTGADSNNQANVDNSSKAKVNQQSTGTITNNVNVNAQSGNANADMNTKVGNVSTGKAQANSSVANLFNTILNVKHWFGVLVINVFGDWTGDVNHDSAAGGYSTSAGRAEGAAAAGATAAGSGSGSSALSALPSVGLLAIIQPSGGANVAHGSDATGTSSDVSQDNVKVLTAAAQSTPASTVAQNQSKNMSLMFILSALVLMVAGALMTIDKKLRR